MCMTSSSVKKKTEKNRTDSQISLNKWQLAKAYLRGKNIHDNEYHLLSRWTKSFRYIKL
jgi:hypothetical protein